MSWQVWFPYVAVMALVTYLIRMLPLTLFRKQIRSRFIKSFLYYVPYAVLGAMTFPAVFTSTGNIATATVGVAAALVLSWHNKSLLTVAIAACAAVAVAQGAMMLMGMPL